MTTINFENGNDKLYKATINGSVPMNADGTKLFNKGVDRSLIVFPAWQRTETSNEEKIKKLKMSFDMNLMDPLLLVAWPEENVFHCANGYHRYTATKMLGIDELPCVILIGPSNIKERTRFEIDLFLKQSVSTEPLKAIQMHAARLEIKDAGATALEDLCEKYSITVVPTRGQRPARVLGSYNGTYEIAKTANGRQRLSDVLQVLDVAGYMEEANGLSTKIMSPVDNILREYPFVKVALGEMMRKMSPNILCSKAVARYPERGWRLQLTLYLQDWVVETYHVEPRYDINGKVIPAA